MRILTLTLAAAAAVAFTIPQASPILAQESGVQSRSTQGQAETGGQVRGSGGASIRSERSGQSIRSERSRTTVGIGTNRERVGIHGRSQVRVGVRTGVSDDVLIKRKRPRHVVAVDHEPSVTVIKKKKRFTTFEPERRAIILKKRQPGVAFRSETDRTTVRSRSSGDVRLRANVRLRETGRTSVRSQETTSRSSATINRSQRSPGSTTGSGGSQSRSPSRGNTGNQTGGEGAR